MRAMVIAVAGSRGVIRVDEEDNVLTRRDRPCTLFI